jgi:hypothetical protein
MKMEGKRGYWKKLWKKTLQISEELRISSQRRRRWGYSTVHNTNCIQYTKAMPYIVQSSTLSGQLFSIFIVVFLCLGFWIHCMSSTLTLATFLNNTVVFVDLCALPLSVFTLLHTLCCKSCLLYLIYVVFALCACRNWFLAMCMIIPFPVWILHLFPFPPHSLSDLWHEQLSIIFCSNKHQWGKRLNEFFQI